MLTESNSRPGGADFLAALENDLHQIVSSFNQSGKIEYISKGVKSCLGLEANDILLDGPFDRSPEEGAVYYRPHRDGSSVRFVNTFYSVSDGGRVYCIDKLAGSRDSAAEHTLLVDPGGVVVSWQDSSEAAAPLGAEFLGKKLFSVALDPYRNGIVYGLVKARKGKSHLNVKCVLSSPVSGVEYHGALDFHHRTDGAVVVLARLSQSEAAAAAVVQVQLLCNLVSAVLRFVQP